MQQSEDHVKIMIVDDHTAMRAVLRTVSALAFDEPVEFIECESGEEAVVKYEAEHPDWVLMDVQLRQMNGFDAAKRIRSHDATAKVVIVTSFDTPSIRLRAESMSMTGFVPKDRLSEIRPLLQSIQNAQ